MRITQEFKSLPRDNSISSSSWKEKEASRHEINISQFYLDGKNDDNDDDDDDAGRYV